MKDFKINKNRTYLMKRMGDISQLAGLRRTQLTDGKAQGVEAVEVNTGSGFRFTVLPGRGMDIAWTEYKGVPVSYMSKTGVVSPAYYENEGLNWLRSFFAGMLTTCGLSNVGGPCVEEEHITGPTKQGLHGRISNMGADNVCCLEGWEGDTYKMHVSGRMRESALHGENLTLRREVSAEMGKKCLTIHDVVENEGFVTRPLMLLYHINIGYPVLDEGSRLICNSLSVTPNDDWAKEGLDKHKVFEGPVCQQMEQVYFHDLKAKYEGDTCVAIVNDTLELGVYIKFNKNQLPNLTEWKQMAEAEYVVGLEPANCLPIGRTRQREAGTLQYIQPGEQKKIDLEIGILDGAQEIAEFEWKVKNL